MVFIKGCFTIFLLFLFFKYLNPTLYLHHTVVTHLSFNFYFVFFQDSCSYPNLMFIQAPKISLLRKKTKKELEKGDHSIFCIHVKFIFVKFLENNNITVFLYYIYIMYNCNLTASLSFFLLGLTIINYITHGMTWKKKKTIWRKPLTYHFTHNLLV